MQTRLRQHANRQVDAAAPNEEAADSLSSEKELFQCLRASRYAVEGVAEAIVELRKEDGSVTVKVRGRRSAGRRCFLLLEEVLGVMDQVLLDMSPGTPVDKHVLSAHDLRAAASRGLPVHAYSPADVVAALEAASDDGGGGEDFSTASLRHPTHKEVQESLSDLVCFGSAEICSLLLPGTLLHASVLSTLTRQALCALLDPEDQLGRDWCLLAVRMGLGDRLPKLDAVGGGRRMGNSQTAKLLEEWERLQSSSIGLHLPCTRTRCT